jgi:hypothetical protein
MPSKDGLYGEPQTIFVSILNLSNNIIGAGLFSSKKSRLYPNPKTDQS